MIDKIQSAGKTKQVPINGIIEHRQIVRDVIYREITNHSDIIGEVSNI